MTASYNVERDHVAFESINKRPLVTTIDNDYDIRYSGYLTRYAFQKYKKQSIKSHEVQFTNISEEAAECIQYNTHIDVTFLNCSCRFYKTMNLPCSHIIALRLNKEKPVFDPELCGFRWTKENAKFISEYDYAVPNCSSSQLQIIQATNQNQPTRKMTPNDKFRAAEKETKKICEIYAEKSQDEYDLLMKCLKVFRTCVENNQIPGK